MMCPAEIFANSLIIKANGFVGVGLVTLEEYVVKAIKKHHKYESLDKIMNG